MEEKKFNIVQLNTEKLHEPAKVSVFQFGTMAAPIGSSYLISPGIIPAGLKSVEVFWIDRNIVIPKGYNVRYNLHFEIDPHNCIHLQVLIRPWPDRAYSSYQTEMRWRWAATFFDYNSKEWTDKEMDLAEWTDREGVPPHYYAKIGPSSNGINIQLGKHD